jgi:glutamate-1-semialdehyde aminotransferase
MSRMERTNSKALFEENRRWIPGGVVSLNRKVEPEIAFVRGQGAYVWDVDGARYIDFHAGFAPYLLGHGMRLMITGLLWVRGPRRGRARPRACSPAA